MKTETEINEKYQEVRYRLEEAQALFTGELDPNAEASLIEDIDYYAAACYWLARVLK